MLDAGFFVTSQLTEVERIGAWRYATGLL